MSRGSDLTDLRRRVRPFDHVPSRSQIRRFAVLDSAADACNTEGDADEEATPEHKEENMVTLNFPGCPPVKGTGPVITAIEADSPDLEDIDGPSEDDLREIEEESPDLDIEYLLEGPDPEFTLADYDIFPLIEED